MGFTRAQLEDYRGATVPDLHGENVRLVFVGINPGLWTAATRTHFARPGNRFYPALYRAGIIDRELDAGDGLSEAENAVLTDRGIAITNLVDRASARADELTRDELRRGGRQLVERLRQWRQVRGPAGGRDFPRHSVVAIVGISAYRVAFDNRKAQVGEQDRRLAGSRLWVLPNPSGLNAHETVDSLARAYRQPAEAAGIELDPPRW